MPLLLTVVIIHGAEAEAYEAVLVKTVFITVYHIGFGSADSNIGLRMDGNIGFAYGGRRRL